MSTVGFDTWSAKTCPTVFVVRNIAEEGKRIHLFHYPIENGEERDLMTIPYVSEADIRHSLLKGQLNIKLRAKEIVVTRSNIDLLQFDECHKVFLQNGGVTEGLEVTTGVSVLPFAFKQEISLIGDLDNTNKIFRTPDYFINGNLGNNTFKILVKHNGRSLVENIDFFVAESGGQNTGYDTIILNFAPSDRSILIADYIVRV